MADYTRFEFLLPTYYHIDEPDGPVDYELVKTPDVPGAMRFLAGWKRCLQKGLHQEIILILHTPVQTIGGELST